MTDEDFLRKLREAFSVEADEHLQAMCAGLLDLEKAPPAARKKEIVETVFRDAHSLKGAARAVSRGDVESVCQALEGVFSQWKQKDTPVAAETFDLLNRAIDLVARLLRLPEEATSASERAEITDVVRQLAGTPASAPAPVAAPAQTPLAAEPPPVAIPPPESVPLTAAEADAPQIAETVRIPMAKMDDLLRHAEEMIAVKLTARRNAAELHTLGGVLEAWRKEWAKVRDIPRTGLANQSPAALAKLADFLDWNQGYMRSVEKRLVALAGTAEQDERSTATLVDNLLEDAKRLVMLPFGTLFDIFPKLVRDLARSEAKSIGLVVHGREVEIDKRILQEMKDPLIHLVRNSIDHGLERPAVRTAAHKSPTGTLTLAVAQLDGSKVEILVSDDGAGIDVARVKASAVRAGNISAEDAEGLDDQAALSLIFASGVSTSPIITEISGRGLGMAIVREKVERLGGQISIETAPGEGTTFRIVLPVTLATFKGILVNSGGQTFVIPTSRIERIKRVPREGILTVENRETISFEGQTVALVRLDEVLGLPPRPEPGAFFEVVVLGSGDQRIGFAADSVLSEQEVLVKVIGHPLLRVRNVAGATILGSGTPAIILNTADLLKSAIRLAAGPRLTRTATAATTTRAREILVADDSVTSRMLLKNILESAGYRVTTAIDGVDALTTLKSQDFDLLVSDVEMPRMDGFELTEKVRADQKLAELPVVLVTALGSREHQERGIDVGANAYIVKSSFDQSNLLGILAKLV
jgi:two-component system chemotaxis sensor kinase CheA